MPCFRLLFGLYYVLRTTHNVVMSQLTSLRKKYLLGLQTISPCTPPLTPLSFLDSPA
jgi:hypothetical protein